MAIFGLKLTPETHDIILKDGSIEVSEDIEVIGRNLETRLKTLKGEWVLDNTYGFDFDVIFGKRIPDLQLIETALKTYILDTFGVVDIVSFKFDYLPGNFRSLTVSFIATTIFGGEITVSSISIPPSLPTPPVVPPPVVPPPIVDPPLTFITVNDFINPGVLTQLSYPVIVINDNPIAYWRFSNQAGTGNTVNEMGGSFANIFPPSQTILGGPALKTNDTSSSVKMILPQGRAEVSVSPADSLNSLIQFTIEMLFQIDPTSGGPRRTLISHQIGDGPQFNDYWIYIDNLTQLGISMGAVNSILSAPISLNVPHYLVVTREANGATLIYLDNTLLLNAGVFPILNTLGNIMIGNDFGVRNTPFEGFISDVAIYNKVITANIMNVHYTSFNGDSLVLVKDYEKVSVNTGIISQAESLSFVDQVNVSIDYLYFSTIVKDNPLSYYRHGELSGTVSLDVMGLDNQIYINTPTLGVQGLLVSDPDTAVLFTSVNSEFTRGGTDRQEYSFTDGITDLPFTLEAWINLDVVSDEYPIIGKNLSLLTAEYLLQVNPDGSLFGVVYDMDVDNQHRWLTSAGLIESRNDYHVVATYEGLVNSGKIYLNGKEQVVTYSDIGSYVRMRNTIEKLHIGARFTAANPGSKYFEGVIDEPAIYNYSLSPAQILNHYNIGINLPTEYWNIVISDNPMAFYRMNETVGLLAVDILSGPDAIHSAQVNVGSQGLKVNDTSLSVDYKDNSYLQNTVITPSSTDPINISGDISIELILRFDLPEPFQNRTILARVDGGGINMDYHIYISSDQAIAVSLPDIGEIVLTPNNLVPGTVYHFVVTISSTQINLYVNGVIVSTGNIANPRVPSLEPIYIGNDQQGLPFLGLISDVSFYNRVLPVDVILSHSNSVFGV